MRRIYNPMQYEFLQHQQHWNVFMTYGALLLGVGPDPLRRSTSSGRCSPARKAPLNPWNATTLEWTAASPPPHLQLGADAPDRVPRALRVQRPRGGGRLLAAVAAAGARGGAAARSLTEVPGGEAGAPSGRAHGRRDLRADRLRRARDQHGCRPGGAGLADDLRPQHVPVPVVPDGRRRLLRAQPPAARRPRRAPHAGAGRRAVAARRPSARARHRRGGRGDRPGRHRWAAGGAAH